MNERAQKLFARHLEEEDKPDLIQSLWELMSPAERDMVVLTQALSDFAGRNPQHDKEISEILGLVNS